MHYIAPLNPSNSIGRNLVAGPVNTGYVYPPAPIGPDFNGPLGAPYDGENVTVTALGDAFAAYFTRYAPNLSRVGAWPDGESSYYLPDKPGIPVGAMTVLENTSFANITWDNVDSTWNQLDMMQINSLHLILIHRAVSAGDKFIVNDPVITNTGASYVAARW